MTSLWLVSIALACAVFASAASAQFTSSGGGGGTATNGVSSFQNVTTTFDGISVDLRALVKDPAGGGALRLVLLLTHSSDKERRLLFVGPEASLIDSMGNVYIATEAVGVEACISSRRWRATDTAWCVENNQFPTTRLAPGVPVTVALTLQPTEGFSQELADMSTSVSLRLRIAHYSEDLSSHATADIVINDIPTPQS
jgi:hypothetical protein